jgi:hypothetical protein
VLRYGFVKLSFHRKTLKREAGFAAAACSDHGEQTLERVSKAALGSLEVSFASDQAVEGRG